MRNHIDIILQQCKNQQAETPRDIAGFATAYFDAYSTVTKIVGNSPDYIEHRYIQTWAWLINKDLKQYYNYRTVPISIGGETKRNQLEIPRQMKNLIDAMTNARIDATKAYKEFEEIHPFIDGNGRVGHLIWAVMIRDDSGIWPIELPPNLWK